MWMGQALLLAKMFSGELQAIVLVAFECTLAGLMVNILLPGMV